MDKHAARTGVYAVLAELTKEPDADLVSQLPAMTAYLTAAFAALDYPLPPGDYAAWPLMEGTRGDLRAAYIRSFTYPPDTRVLPVESVYRQWTFDPTAKVSFAREKGYLMSDAALHMKALYVGYGLSLPAAMTATPDHLSLELEFACFLLEHETAGRYATFLQEHLDWVGDLWREAEAKEIPLFYRQVLKVTARFLDSEREIFGG
jgi:TorA maturation chaperone TorD